MDTLDSSSENVATDTAVTKQPKALMVLFSTEIWERFSYWSLQSLLVLYMGKALLYSDTRSFLIFSAFNAILLGAPIFGGLLADKVIGCRRAIVVGAVFLALGYFMLTLHGQAAFYYGLTLLCFGNGLFKPNISNILGTCYKPNDGRRNSGFTLFYLSINIGGLVGIALCGFLAKVWGWNAAFITAGIGVIIGLIVFVSGHKIITRDQIVRRLPGTEKSRNIMTAVMIVGMFALLVPVRFLLNNTQLVNIVMVLLTVLILAYVLWTAKKETVQVRHRFYVAIFLVIISIVFWALYFQLPMSMTLFVSRDIDLHLFGLAIPPSVVFGLNGIFMLIFAPLMVKYWNGLIKRNIHYSFPTKFAVGTILMGLGYLIVSLGAHFIQPGVRGGLWSVALCYAFQTMGELWLSPIGLAMITVLVPEKIRGFMMGVWFFGMAGANLISGQLGKMASIPTHLQDNMLSAPIYAHAFFMYGVLTLLVGVALFCCVPALRKLL